MNVVLRCISVRHAMGSIIWQTAPAKLKMKKTIPIITREETVQKAALVLEAAQVVAGLIQGLGMVQESHPSL